MPSAYLHFLRQLLIFSVILGIITVGLSLSLPNGWISPALPFLFPFFVATSLISFYYLLKTVSERFIRFVNTFLLTIIVKLFLYIGVMVIYMMINRRDAVPFILGFFVLYLCYSVFEAICIVRLTQTQGPGKSNP